jgi:hypothetical protein
MMKAEDKMNACPVKTTTVCQWHSNCRTFGSIFQFPNASRRHQRGHMVRGMGALLNLQDGLPRQPFPRMARNLSMALRLGLLQGIVGQTLSLEPLVTMVR